MFTIIVFVMNMTLDKTTRLVLAQECLKASQKMARYYAQRAEVEKSEEMRKAAAGSEMACAFYEEEIKSLS
jgi:hypothetical protein